VVQPVADVRFAVVDAAPLREFVFMVRKRQVGAAAVDVDGVSEVLANHRGALDVPTGTAATPRAVPTGQLGGGRFPQYEVLRIAFVRGDFDACSVEHVFERTM